MVHNMPENFNISDFDVFHSALILIYCDVFLGSCAQGNLPHVDQSKKGACPKTDFAKGRY